MNNQETARSLDSLDSLTEFENLSGYTVSHIKPSDFKMMTNILDETDRLQGNDIDGINSAFFDWLQTSSTEWLDHDSRPRYTTDAYVCLAGLAVNEKGQVKLFHYQPAFSSMLLRNELLTGGAIGGIVGSTPSSFHKKYGTEFLAASGMVPLYPDFTIEEPDELKDWMPFHILIDPQTQNIFYTFTPGEEPLTII